MIYVFIALFLVLQSLEVLGTANVGTVLFTKADLDNKTWSADDVALLRARLYFQHLLPHIITPQTPNYVETLLKYFKNGYLTISRESPDVKTDNILTLAFTDVIGGYMKMFALPIAKYAYYGGTLPTRDTLKLFLFYEDLKNYLGKNGSTWSSPDYARLDAVTINVAVTQMPLVRSMVNQDPCIYLSYFEKTGQGLSLPTPKIDWATRTMFVPLANQSLIDLRSTNMTDALLKYYHAASHCLLSARPKKLESFNQRFQLWLQEDVMPHLNDDRLYAPLQGVLSLINNTYDAETYQNLMIYGTADEPGSHGGHSKKNIIIIAIVLFEIFCCLPTVMYVFSRKKKNGSHSSSSSVNVVFETRTDRSLSDYDLRMSKSSPVKRHGGSKWRQKPVQMMEAGEVISPSSQHSMGTEMKSCPVPDYANMATMVDEFLDHRRRKSCNIQTVPFVTSSVYVTSAPVRNETSDDTGKTVTLSSTTGPSRTSTNPSNTTTNPSKTTTAPSKTTPSPPKTTPDPFKTTPSPPKTIPGPSKTTPGPFKTTPGPSKTIPGPSKTTTGPFKTTPGPKTTVETQAQNTAGPSTTSTVTKPTGSPRRRSTPKCCKLDSKVEYKRKLKKELEKVTNFSPGKTADYLKSQLFNDTALHHTSKVLMPYKKPEKKKGNEEKKGKGKSKKFKIHAEHKSIMIQGGNNPYMEICIDGPQLEAYSVDVSRNEEKGFKKSGSPATPRASRIPKRALWGRQPVESYKRLSEATMRERKSRIPILMRAFDDSFLKRTIDLEAKVDKMNVTF